MSGLCVKHRALILTLTLTLILTLTLTLTLILILWAKQRARSRWHQECSRLCQVLQADGAT